MGSKKIIPHLFFLAVFCLPACIETHYNLNEKGFIPYNLKKIASDKKVAVGKMSLDREFMNRMKGLVLSEGGFRDAVVKTLEGSGILASDNNEGDYELSGEGIVVLPSTVNGPFSNKCFFAVTYTLKSLDSNEVVWMERIYSETRERSAFGEPMSSGYTICEEAVRENIACLLERLEEKVFLDERND